MFGSNDGRNSGDLLDRRAFLIYHPEQHSKELDLITRWLLMHHVEVGSAWYEGSWENFKLQIVKGGSGIVIVSWSQTLHVDSVKLTLQDTS